MAPGRNNNGDDMNTNRTIKTSTALRNALAAAGVKKDDAKNVIDALKRAAKIGQLTTGATVTHYPDGWVPTSYRYRAPGRAVEVEVAPFGVAVTERQIDRKRPHGRGPRVIAYARREGQSRGALVASL